MNPFRSISFYVGLLLAIVGLTDCKQRQVVSGLSDSDAIIQNLQPSGPTLRVDNNQTNVQRTYYYNEGVEGGLTTLEIAQDGSTRFRINQNATQNTPFTDADNDGTREVPELLIFKKDGSTQAGQIDPVFNGAGVIKPSRRNNNSVSYQLDAVRTRPGETYYFAYKHDPNVKFNNNYSVNLSVRHSPIISINGPELEIPVAGTPDDGFYYNKNIDIAVDETVVWYKLNHTGTPTNETVEFDANFYDPNGNGTCDFTLQLLFKFDEGNGVQPPIEVGAPYDPCNANGGGGGFVFKPGGSYWVGQRVKSNTPGQKLGVLEANIDAYERGSGNTTTSLLMKPFTDSSNNIGPITLSGRRSNRQRQNNGKVDQQEYGFKGQFAGLTGRTFVDVNAYGSVFDPLNAGGTNRRPNKLIIFEGQTEIQNVAMGSGNDLSAQVLIEVKENVDYTFRFETPWGPDVTGNISLRFRISEAILASKTPAVDALIANLKDVSGNQQQENYYFDTPNDFKNSIESLHVFIPPGQPNGPQLPKCWPNQPPSPKPCFMYNLHAPPVNTIDPPGGQANAPKIYPNEADQLDGATGRPLMAKTVFAAMEHIRRNWHQQQDIDHLNDQRDSYELRYVSKGTISACLGNTAAHWSDLILHFYCQFGQMRSCYTGWIRSNAQNIKNMPDNTDQEKLMKALAASKLRVGAYEACINTGDNLPANLTAQDARNQGKINEYEWRWVKNTTFKVDGQDVPMARVFQYVMTSPTFRWSMQQEQDLLNAFYRVDDAGGNKCKTVRGPRGIEDTGSDYCAANKKHRELLAPAGR